MRILIVEDDEQARSALQRWIGSMFPEATVLTAENATTVVRLTQEEAFDLITMDGALENSLHGWDIVAYLRAHGCQSKIVMLSADQNYVRLGIEAGANTGCTKARCFTILPLILRDLGFEPVEKKVA